MNTLQTLITAFFSFKAYVMLPILMLLIALAARVPVRQAVLSTVALAAGFAGVFIAFNFFVANISPAVQQLSQARGLHFPVLDVGWLPLAAITWASPLAAISIPVVLALNIAMLALGWTRAIYIDIWNYWHFALMGALAMTVSGQWWVGMAATLALAVYCFKMTEWNAPDVERETGLKGIAVSPVSVNGLLPYFVSVDWLLDRVPGLRRWTYNPQKELDAAHAGQSNVFLTFAGEPMMIGLLMGLALAIAAGYGLKETLELGVHIAAVMFILPKSAGLIGEAMIPITSALRAQVERRFPSRGQLVVAMDTGFLLHHKSVVITGLLLMALAIVIALVLPGNTVLPLGDLSNLISVMSLSVLVFRGNVVRAVLAGVPVVITFLLVSSHMAPLYTELAQGTPSFDASGLGQITSFTDGGHQIRFLMLEALGGAWWTLPVALLLGLAMWLTRQRYIRLTAEP
ncbi:MAG: PTS galactitol transporter subunit IIC [Curvibacter sp.]|nr:MAG: PTS galactitol transporter subunit IIC [Curvibacter sp.]